MLAAAMSFGLATAAQAIPTTYSLEWVGVGNAAKASGTITIDDIVFDTAGNFSTSPPAPFSASSAFPGLGVTDFSITVTDATIGNGTFGFADFALFYLVLGAPVDDSVEMVGQAGLLDFNIFAMTTGAPNADYDFLIKTASNLTGDTETLELASFSPVSVPIPAGGLLLLSALGAYAIGRKAQRT